MSDGQGPPEWANASENARERFEERDGTVIDHGDPDQPNKAEVNRILNEEDLSNAPPWAQLLYHQQRAIMAELGIDE